MGIFKALNYLSPEGRELISVTRDDPDVERKEEDTSGAFLKYKSTTVSMYDAIRELQLDNGDSIGESWLLYRRQMLSGGTGTFDMKVLFRAKR